MQSSHQERMAQKTWRSPHIWVLHWLRVPHIFLRAPLSSDAVAFSLSREASHLRDGKLATSYAEAHPHMLRHACGFALADQGADTWLIQDYLGHLNIQHTVMYTATNPARFERL